jgi:hypothetical protein
VSLNKPWPEQATAFLAEGFHRVVMLIRSALTARQGEGVHHRPPPRLDVKLVETSQHGLTVGAGSGRVHRPRRCLPGHRVRTPELPGLHRRASRTDTCHPRIELGPSCSGRPDRFASNLDPPTEIPSLRPGDLIPSHVDCPQEPVPAQQGHPVRPQRGRRSPAALQVTEEGGDRTDGLAVRVKQPIRLEWIASWLE